LQVEEARIPILSSFFPSEKPENKIPVGHNVVFQHPVARHLSCFLFGKTVLRTTFSLSKIN
jgi:hypothetical protein